MRRVDCCGHTASRSSWSRCRERTTSSTPPTSPRRSARSSGSRWAEPPIGRCRGRRTAVRSSRSGASTSSSTDVPVPSSAWGSKRARTLLKRLAIARGQLVDPRRADRAALARGGRCRSAERPPVGPALCGAARPARWCHRRSIIDPARPRAHRRRHRALVCADRRRGDRCGLQTASSCRTIATRTGRRPSGMRSEPASVAPPVAWPRSATPDEAIALWRRVLTQDPYDEGVHRAVVATLRASSRLGEARTAYQSYVAAMEDLGVRPTTWDEIAR